MIRTVLAPNPGVMTGRGTNTYLVDDSQGRLVVIDPGPNDPRHLAAILDAAAPIGVVEAILVTHGHSDHLPAAFPLAHATGARVAGHHALSGVQRVLADGDLIDVGESLSLKFSVVETPGHTDDSLSFWVAADRALFTGDLVAGEGTVVVDDQPGGLSKYMASLGRIGELGPSIIYPGHGPMVEDGVARIQEYLAHRRGREEQILQALKTRGTLTVDQLVDGVYPGLALALRSPAARNVRACLGKLQYEGRVHVNEAVGRWELA